MLFNSMEFLLFFPTVFAINYILPKKTRYLWLLASSYFFYMQWNAKYGLLLLGVTLITYFCGILIAMVYKREKIRYAKAILIAGIISNMGILVYFKYVNFLLKNVNKLFRLVGNRNIDFVMGDIILPVGISFFCFQAMGYLFDVYRKKVEVETNFFYYALFVSFFPQLVAGPIERSGNLIHQLKMPAALDSERVRIGFLYIIYGLLQKVVISDNIAQIINPIFIEWQAYSGIEIFIAIMLFSIQIYCDFGGYTNIAIGSAKLLGIDLTQNFSSPYMAVSVTDFWKRWHKSLTSWFTDYLYIPLGGNRKGTTRKYFNVMVVFLASGLWHGASWNFVIWGAINGAFLIIENALGKWKRRIDLYSIPTVLRRICTFIIISFTWLFFRADSLMIALKILKKIVLHLNFREVFSEKVFSIFPTTQVFFVIFMAIIMLTLIDYIREEKKESVHCIFLRQKTGIRWLMCFLAVLLILILGAYGEEYTQTQFIYFQF